MFVTAYTLLAVLAIFVSFPLLLLLSFKSKYRRSIPARFFLWRNPPLDSGGIWFHSCSLGESKAISSIVESLKDYPLRFTTTTQTGKEIIDGYSEKNSRYLPFEPLLWLWERPQKALVVMEAELWYLLFYIAGRKGAKRYLINARISDRSWKSYYRFRWFYKYLFSNIDIVFAQTQKDAKRLACLGAKNICVVGNIKFSNIAKVSKEYIKPDRFVLTASSTHEGEEEIILKSFLELKRIKSDALLILIPRHPERFSKVADMTERFASENSLQFNLFSKSESFDGDIVLMDRMGEAINIYAISDTVILGGAFEPIGGHNAVEVAQFGIRLISGPHFFNQRELFDGIKGITIAKKDELISVIKRVDTLPNTELKFKGEPVEKIVEELKRCFTI